MAKTCGSKLLFVCTIWGMGRADEIVEAAGAPESTGVSQTTTFDASPPPFAVAGFRSALKFAISTLIVTGDTFCCASKAHAQKHTEATLPSFPIRRIVIGGRTKTCTPDSG